MQPPENDNEKKSETLLRIVPPVPVEKAPLPSEADTPQSAFPFTEKAPADATETAAIIEAILFASEKPMTRSTLKEALGGAYSSSEIDAALSLLQARHAAPWGLRLMEVASGFQLRTAPEHRNFVVASLRIKPQRLSKAALETLSIVAYRQPLTRAEVDEIRGVDSAGSLRTLLERNFLRILGRKEEAGRPVLYGTSREFLEFFGLRDLQSMPSLSEFRALHEEERAIEISKPEEDFSSETFASRKPGEVPVDVVESLAKAMAEIDRVSQNLPIENKDPKAEAEKPKP